MVLTSCVWWQRAVGCEWFPPWPGQTLLSSFFLILSISPSVFMNLTFFTDKSQPICFSETSCYSVAVMHWEYKWNWLFCIRFTFGPWRGEFFYVVDRNLKSGHTHTKKMSLFLHFSLAISFSLACALSVFLSLTHTHTHTLIQTHAYIHSYTWRSFPCIHHRKIKLVSM